jgi:hypothetical protein
MVALKQACEEGDRPFVELTVIPFRTDLPAILPIDPSFVFYGYTTLILNVHNSERWRQGVFFDPEAFRPESYQRHYGDLYLNADMQVTTFAELDSLDLDPKVSLCGRTTILSDGPGR